MSANLPPKKDVAIALLERSSVFVHLDPRRDLVVVPPWFKKQPRLVLQVGLNLAVPIPDLNVDDECISCTLSFNRSPFYCWIPWSAIFALVDDDGRGLLWPDDVPREILTEQQATPRPGAPQKPKTKPQLRALPSTPPSEAGAEPSEERSSETTSAEPSVETTSAEPSEERSAMTAAEPSSATTEPPVERAVAAREEPAEDATPEARPARKLPAYLRVVK